MSMIAPGFHDKDFRQAVSNFSVEKLEPGEATQTALWTKSAAKELQQARSDWKGWLVTLFYETTVGNGLRKSANFFVEIWRCITEFRIMQNAEIWNKPNPEYFKINLNDGSYAYYQREAAFRLGYRHVLATVPLHRVHGKLELNPKKVSNPLQQRRLELLKAMLEDRIFKMLLDTTFEGEDSTRLFKDYLLHYEDDVPDIFKKHFSLYRKEMERLLNEYDFINPNKESDLGKYQEFTSYVEKRSKNIPMEELSNQAKEVIDVAGRINAIARSNIRLNRRTFIALITGVEMLPEKVVPGAKFFNERAAKVAKAHLRLAAAAHVSSLLQRVDPTVLEEIREMLKEFMIDERLYGLKRNAFTRRLQTELELEAKGHELDQTLLDLDPDASGTLTLVSHLLGFKWGETLDPPSFYELFLQLGFLKDPKVIEKRREVNSFIESYQAFRDKNPVTYEEEPRHTMWEIVDEKDSLRYVVRGPNETVPAEVQFANRFSQQEIVQRLLNYCADCSTLRVSSLQKLSRIVHANIGSLKKSIFSLAKRPSLGTADDQQLQMFKNNLQAFSKALDQINAEFKMRGETTILSSPSAELSELYAQHQTKLFKVFYFLYKQGVIAFKNNPELYNQVSTLTNETIECIHKVKRRMVEAASEVEKQHLKERLHILKEHLWVLNLLSPSLIDKMCEIEMIIVNTKYGLDNSRSYYYPLQMEIFKNAPSWISKAPQNGKTLLEAIWSIFDLDVEELPLAAQKFVKEIEDNEAFFKRLQSLAAKRPDAFYRPTDLNNIQQFLESAEPLNARVSALLQHEKTFAKHQISFKRDAEILNNAVTTAIDARNVIQRHMDLVAKRKIERS